MGCLIRVCIGKSLAVWYTTRYIMILNDMYCEICIAINISQYISDDLYFHTYLALHILQYFLQYISHNMYCNTYLPIHIWRFVSRYISQNLYCNTYLTILIAIDILQCISCHTYLTIWIAIHISWYAFHYLYRDTYPMICIAIRGSLDPFWPHILVSSVKDSHWLSSGSHHTHRKAERAESASPPVHTRRVFFVTVSPLH